MSGTQPETAGRRPWRWVMIFVLAAAAVIAGVAGHAIAGDQARGNLLPPSIATDKSGLSTAAWTEIGRAGIRVSQESAPGRWSRPLLLDPQGGPGDVAVGRDRLAHVAYTDPRGLLVADQLPAGGATPRFHSELVTRDAAGRPSVAISPGGGLAVIYESRDSSSLRIARRQPSGGWKTSAAGISGTQPLLTPGGAGSVLGASLEGSGVSVARAGRSGPGRPVGGAQSPDPLDGFDLAAQGGAPLVSYVEQKLQLVILDQPERPAGLQVVGTTSAIGSFAAVAASRRSTVVLFPEPRYGLISFVVVRGRSRSPTQALAKGRSGDIALDPQGKVAHIAYWDPAGLGLIGATVRLRQARLSPAQPITSYQPAVVRFKQAPISIPQTGLPDHDKASIWLASLALLLMIAAGWLLLVERRHGLRLLPFAIVLIVLAVFAARGVYLAQVGIYGLPPNDLLPLDRSAVSAVVDALLILAGSAGIVCAIGFLLPVGWGRGALAKLKGISLPESRSALWTLGAFLLVSLLVGLYLVRNAGLKQLFESRQTAFAGNGYELALLAAGAGAWLVYFAVVGWPSERRERALLVFSGAITLVPLLLSGARSVVILGFVVPIALLVHLRIRPISLREAAIGVVVLLAFAIGTRELTRGGTESSALEEATKANGTVARVLKPALGWTEAAGLDALVLVRTQYLPRFGTNPAQTAGPFAGFAVPRSLWPGKPRSAMDTFSEKLNPWNYEISKVGKTTTLAGEFEIDGGLAGVFIGFAVFAVLLTLIGELLAGVGGIFGILVAIALLPRVGAAFWGDSFNAGWGGIVLIVMMGLAIIAGHLIEARRGRIDHHGPAPGRPAQARMDP